MTYCNAIEMSPALNDTMIWCRSMNSVRIFGVMVASDSCIICLSSMFDLNAEKWVLTARKVSAVSNCPVRRKCSAIVLSKAVFASGDSKSGS